ncbi:MAG: 2-polyprenyl-3-methyl-6-methoxy-1,4-benzoquinone monooxygenase [Pseudomonadales bacterium]|nr:2-polyprenyl-3-methyl-6-methoxy-1,4-benzoquinone monooxygenase [Pseudomonadales bacterium]
MNRALSDIDRVVSKIDAALRTVSGAVGPQKRPSPAQQTAEAQLSEAEKVQAARLMRVNHTGEVCAQALYHGQALTARNQATVATMQEAASEEADHLYWCETRLKELDSHVSYLNPFWYASSFAMGALTGLLGDKVNLGFVAATEEEVCKHLDRHLAKLPETDHKSREILTQMREDELKHQHTAEEAGGARFPRPVKSVMKRVSDLMTRTTYWI